MISKLSVHSFPDKRSKYNTNIDIYFSKKINGEVCGNEVCRHEPSVHRKGHTLTYKQKTTFISQLQTSKFSDVFYDNLLCQVYVCMLNNFLRQVFQ